MTTASSSAEAHTTSGTATTTEGVSSTSSDTTTTSTASATTSSGPKYLFIRSNFTITNLGYVPQLADKTSPDYETYANLVESAVSIRCI